MIIPPVPEGVFKIGAEINLFFNSSKADAHSSIYTYFSPFLISLVKGAVILEKSCTNLR